MKRISKLQAYMLMQGAGSRIFSVLFEKKTDGSLRLMNCRFGVKKGLTGKGMSYDPKKREMIPVYDMGVSDYRMITLKTLMGLRLDGQTYVVGNASSNIVEDMFNQHKPASTKKTLKSVAKKIEIHHPFEIVERAVALCKKNGYHGAAFVLNANKKNLI